MGFLREGGFSRGVCNPRFPDTPYYSLRTKSSFYAGRVKRLTEEAFGSTHNDESGMKMDIELS